MSSWVWWFRKREFKNHKNLSFSPNSFFICIWFFFNNCEYIFFHCILLSIAKNENILRQESNFKEMVKYLNDLIYILDFLVSFVRGYYDYEMKIIRNNKRIIIHYLKQEFLWI